MSAARISRNAGLLVGGTVLGVLVAIFLAFLYTRTVREDALEAALAEQLGIPRQAFEATQLLPRGPVRLELRNVALLGTGNDTVLAAPRLQLRLDPFALQGKGPIELGTLTVREPFIHLVQNGAGEWNVQQVLRVTAGGEPVQVEEAEEGRAIVLRDVRIVDGRARIATPSLVRTVRDLDAVLPRVRVGGPDGWRVEFADLRARLAPETRVRQLSGWVEEVPDEGFRFGIDAFRTGASALAGEGLIRLGENGPQLDAQLTANPLALADLQWFLPSLPSEGEIEGSFAAAPLVGGRTEIEARDLEITLGESRIAGAVAARIGGDRPPFFFNTRLSVDPLRLAALEQLGFGEQIPLAGAIRGTVESIADSAGVQGGALRVDLVATAEREDISTEESTVGVNGTVAFVEGDVPVRLDGFRIELRPLDLTALAPFLPEQRERLQGVLRGGVTLAGTPAELRVEDGQLSYEVGAASATRLAEVEGRVELQPELDYQLSARAEPLSLATLTELVPALPFRTAELSGPIQLGGTAERLHYEIDLQGAAGEFASSGDLSLGDPLSLDISGELRSLQAEALLLRQEATGAALTGTFSAQGTTENLQFNTRLRQGDGRFALEGAFRSPAGEPQLDLAGSVSDFRLGSLVGSSQLFPAPVSGTIRAEGGGREPYRFNIDLRGEGAALDIEGWYAAGAIPVYAASGVVAGLNLQQLPPAAGLPPALLNGTFTVEGRGTTPENLATQLQLDAEGSTIAGIPVEAGTVQGTVREGVLVVDAARIALGNARLSASGAWGLTRPSDTPLRISLTAPDLSRLRPILVATQGVVPQLAGTVAFEGTVAGTLESPTIDGELRARDLQYQEWRAGTLTADLDLTRYSEPALPLRPDSVLLPDSVLPVRRYPFGWVGQVSLNGEELAGFGQELQALRFEAVARPEMVSLGVFARRDDETDLAASGSLDLLEEGIRGAMLESFALRLGGDSWTLTGPTQLRWRRIEGIAVENLRLRRTGSADGFIAIDGRLPPRGEAALQIQAAGVEIGDFLRLTEGIPQLTGTLALDARIEGPVDSPEFAIDTRLADLRFEGGALDTLALSAQFADRRLSGDVLAWAAGSRPSRAEFDVPLRFSIEDLIPGGELLQDEPIRAELLADSLPLALLTGLVPQLRDAAGILAGRVTLAGTPRSPELAGTLRIPDGAISIAPLRVRYGGIQGEITLEGRTVRVDSLVARNGGVAIVEGTIRFDDLQSPLLNLTGTFQDFRAIDEPAIASLALSGRTALTGPLPSPVLTGEVLLTDGTVTLPGFGEPVPLDIADLDVGAIGLDLAEEEVAEPTFVERVRIEALDAAIGEGVWFTTDEARVQIAGDLIVYRAGENLRIYGNLAAERGTYALEVGPVTREFDVVSGQIEFFGTPDLNPAVDIVAEYELRTATEDLTILIDITGTLQSPQLQLTSDIRPPLPESTLLSYLIFGRPESEIGESAEGIAEQLVLQEALLGGYVLAPAEEFLLGTGFVDYVRVSGRAPGIAGLSSTAALGSSLTSTLGTTTIEAGKEIVPDVFLTLEAGVGTIFGQQQYAVGLDWQIDRQWSTGASYEPLKLDPLLQRGLSEDLQYQWSVELRRRWEYGRPDGPDRLPAEAPDSQLPGRIAEPADSIPKSEEAPR